MFNALYGKSTSFSQKNKAVVYKKYGPPDVLLLTEVEKPVPKDNEVLIKVYATTVTAGDCRLRSLKMPSGFGFIARLLFGFFGPRQPILGTELAGVIESTGKDVTKFKVGDQVFAFSGASMGCYVEYKTLPETSSISLKPAHMSFEAAAAISFGGTTALDFFRRANVRSGEKILINGASGGVGTAAIQLAKNYGLKVTGVCSTANLKLVKSLGADKVIDYTKQDFTKNGEKYDLIMDTVGTAPFSRSKDSLRDGGRLLLVLAGLPQMLLAPWASITTNKKVVAGPTSVRPEDVHFLAQLAKAKKYKPVIDRSFPLKQIAKAHSYVDKGHKKGNVIILLN